MGSAWSVFVVPSRHRDELAQACRGVLASFGYDLRGMTLISDSPLGDRSVGFLIEEISDYLTDSMGLIAQRLSEVLKAEIWTMDGDSNTDCCVLRQHRDGRQLWGEEGSFGDAERWSRRAGFDVEELRSWAGFGCSGCWPRGERETLELPTGPVQPSVYAQRLAGRALTLVMLSLHAEEAEEEARGLALAWALGWRRGGVEIWDQAPARIRAALRDSPQAALLALVADGVWALLARGEPDVLEEAVSVLQGTGPGRAALEAQLREQDRMGPVPFELDLSGLAPEALMRLSLRLGFRMLTHLQGAVQRVDPDLAHDCGVMLGKAVSEYGWWVEGMATFLGVALDRLQGEEPRRREAAALAMRLAELLVPLHLALAAREWGAVSELLGAAAAGWERLVGPDARKQWVVDVDRLPDLSDLPRALRARDEAFEAARKVGALANASPRDTPAVLGALDALRSGLETRLRGPLEVEPLVTDTLQRMDEVVRRVARFLGLEPERALKLARQGQLQRAGASL
jgi:hypothetical protein